MARSAAGKSRSRVVVGPGGLLFACAAGLVLLAAVVVQSNLLFWSFGLIVGGLVVAIAGTTLSLGQVEVRRITPEYAVAGEPFVVRYELTNRSRVLPVFGVLIHEHWHDGRPRWRARGAPPEQLTGAPTTFVTHLGPRQHLVAEAICLPQRRGELRFQGITLTTSFPLGGFRRVMQTSSTQTLLVYPPLLRISRRIMGLLSDPDLLGRSRGHRSGGTEEFYGLRDYREGDSPKHIDWKHSAKTARLVTREMTRPGHNRLLIVLDLTSSVIVSWEIGSAGEQTETVVQQQWPTIKAFDAVERAIALTASLCSDALAAGHEVGLVAPGKLAEVILPAQGSGQRRKILQTLAGLDVAQAELPPPPMPMAPTVVIRPGWGRALRRERSGPLVLGAMQMRDYLVDGPSSASKAKLGAAKARGKVA